MAPLPPPPPPPLPCKGCLGLRQVPLSTMLEAAVPGCECCLQLHAGLKTYMEFVDQNLPSEARFEQTDLVSCFNPQLVIKHVQSNTETKIELCKTFSTDENEDSSLGSGIRLEKCISPGTGSKEALSWARQRLTECLKDHDSCSTQKEHTLPSRLLDLHASDLDPLDIRLVLSNSIDQTSKYICLSHCWGPSGPPKTLSSNYTSHLHRIAFESLTKGFQEVITFSRSLNGLRYLWIDSLCLIQDSPADMQRELPLMADIYGHATLTISITHAASSATGCFNTPNPLYHGLAVRSAETGQPLNFRVRKAPLHIPEIEFMFTDTRTLYDSFPLLGRGWCFQERLLSPRVLHFGPAELLWECTKSSVCECGHSTRYASRWKLLNQLSLSASAPQTLLNNWWNIVTAYSSLAFTFQSDRLSALQGLGRVFAARLGEQSVAGLWRGKMARSLVWFVTARGRRVEGAAPSWSWASVDAAVDYIMAPLEHRLCCELNIITLEAAEGKKQYLCLDLVGALAPVELLSEIWDRETTFDIDVPRDERLYLLRICDEKDGYATYLILRPSGVQNEWYERVGYVYDGQQKAGFSKPLEDGLCRPESGPLQFETRHILIM